MFIGLDIGSVSVNAVLMDGGLRIIEDHYVRTKGQPVQTVRRVLADMLGRTPASAIEGIAVTGSGGKLASEILGCPFVNEIIAQSKASALFHPDVRTVIEIGGEDSKLILLERDAETREVRVRDFATNTLCAAGTGSFLDQQASRLGFSIEEFSQVALRSERPPRIAGRCSVFAKTDMIHLQQEGTPDYEIVAGLCHAMARNFKSNIGKGKDFERPIAFHGGVAANQGMIRAFESVLELRPGELLVPEHFASFGAIGAVISRVAQASSLWATGGTPVPPSRWVEAIDAYLGERRAERRTLPQLVDPGHVIHTEPDPFPEVSRKTSASETRATVPDPFPPGNEKINAYVGVDVGSISTNVVVLSEDGKVLARRYLMTAGRPIEAVVRGLKEVGDEVGQRVTVKGCCTTGSGRYLTGDFIGADVVKNEITAHATAAAWVNPDVDTMFEIGGQDSKYVRLENGAIVDFTMNKVCAAGTGSFLEEQAERLGVKIIDEFGRLALGSTAPANLGERCTVFMESDLNHHQQQGVPKQDLVAGLCYSIVYNYLNRVVEDRPVGSCVFFQGGVAANRGVVAAFQAVTGKRIVVPPHHDVMGAIGCALIAQKETVGLSRFKGFDLTRRRYTTEAFECRDCPNLCEVRRVAIEGEPPLHYGSRCGKYDEEKKAGLGAQVGARLPRLFREREQWLLNSYAKNKPDRPNGRAIGIPRITGYFEMFPFWKAFFTECGFQVVPSSRTNRAILREGLERVVAETCFPIKAAHGHVLELLRREVDYLFLPSVVNLKPRCEGTTNSYCCPYVQTVPYIANAALEFDRYPKTDVLMPTIHMQKGPGEVERVLIELSARLGIERRRAREALKVAWDAQRAFYQAVERRGREVLASLREGEVAVVIVGRPYNTCDDGLNLGLPDKLRDLGVLALPSDFVPTDDADIGADYPNMYWRYGQHILSLGRKIGAEPRLQALYITNFGCGPDSFIAKFFTREMRGKPYLTIEVDEHSADVGAVTRCEAFLDSLRSARPTQLPYRPLAHVQRYRRDRVIYVPYMDDHAQVIAAAMRHNGVEAVPLPISDAESVAIGRQFTSGKECFPCIVTTGDIVKTVRRPDFVPARSSFFMPSAMGPCRFGQYAKFHRMVLDSLGFEDVPMVELDQSSTDGFRGDVGSLGTSFRRLAWSGVVLTDLLQKITRQTRPYEKNPGDCDALYAHFLERMTTDVAAGRNLVPLAREIVAAFGTVARASCPGPKPRIGLVGEIYVRCNPHCNNFIARKLEDLGAEVWLPALEEWVDYTAYERKFDSRASGDFRAYLVELITEFVQEREVRRLTRPFRGAIRDFLYEAHTPRVVGLAKPYLPFAIRGEAILSMGRCVEYAHHGFDGVVNVIPFNCMPGTIVDALLERYRRFHPDMPILKMAYDGLTHVGEDTRIEAFVYQTRQHAQRTAGR
ncbi:MAG: CoA activase [Planctomycetes bacterium]|nr:CoA activase [Planctomycetota bacterium]